MSIPTDRAKTILPPSFRHGLAEEWWQVVRKNPSSVRNCVSEIEHGIPGSNWYNHYTATGSWEGMLLVSFIQPRL